MSKRTLLNQLLLIGISAAVAVPGCLGRSLSVLITVDTEGTYGKTPFENMILGRLEGYPGFWGISKIMQTLEKHGDHATFFVDVYEYRLHGTLRMSAMAKEIHDRGHDVELHTHPAQSIDPRLKPAVQEGMYGSNGDVSRLWMNQFDLEEQTQIVRDGKRLLEEWIGCAPIAHRAGNYAADYNTLKALQRNGIPIDASMFYRHPLCGLNQPLLTINQPVVYGDGDATVLEIPVSCYRAAKTLKVGPVSIPLLQGRIVKLDIDSTPIDEIFEVLDEFYRNGMPVATVFMHSYSFVRWNPGYTRFWPDTQDVNKLDSVLVRLGRDPRYRVTTVREFHSTYATGQDVNPIQDPPRIVRSEDYAAVWRKALIPERLKRSKGLQLFVLAHFILAATIVFVAGRRKKSPQSGS